MKNILLVEGRDDKAFVEAMLGNIKVNVDTIEVNDDMKGLSADSLSKCFDVTKNKIIKFGIKKIGIIIDQDDYDIASRLDFVNDCLKTVFNITLDAENKITTFYIDQFRLNIDFSCHFVKVDNVGELEGYLIKIAKSNSNYADCLKQWRECLGNYSITDKEFRKLWVHYYVRYDTSSNDERRHGSKYCNLEYSLNNKREHWDLNSDVLQPIRNYLISFTT